MKDPNLQYVLITAARNEAEHIEQTIRSVISQTMLPKKWIIVSDVSYDQTDTIIERYKQDIDFIQLLRKKAQTDRNFASKVCAIQEALKLLGEINYEFIGNLDADISFEPDYYERVFDRFKDNSKLGIAGGILYEAYSGDWIRQRISSDWSVSGPIQMFRRQCFSDIGGYIPLQRGGIDTVAEIMARMHGWEVKSFNDLKVLHHRRTGTENKSILIVRFNDGIKEYAYGSHPLFEIGKSTLRITEKPFLSGSLLRLAGYSWAYLRKIKRDVPDEVMKALRNEQLRRLFLFFSKRNNKSR